MKFIIESGKLPSQLLTVFDGIDKKMPNGSKYLSMCQKCADAARNGTLGYANFPELSDAAWVATQETYGKTSNAELWEEFLIIQNAIK